MPGIDATAIQVVEALMDRDAFDDALAVPDRKSRRHAILRVVIGATIVGLMKQALHVEGIDLPKPKYEDLPFIDESMPEGKAYLAEPRNLGTLYRTPTGLIRCVEPESRE